MRLISVYGTLRQGCGNHHHLRNSKLLGVSLTQPSFTMYTNGGFPYVTCNGTTSITIETYELNDLDKPGVFALEGYSGIRGHKSNWYDTTSVTTPWGESEIFVMNRNFSLPIVESGDWKNQ